MKKLEGWLNSVRGLVGRKMAGRDPNQTTSKDSAFSRYRDFAEDNAPEFPATEISHPEIQDAIAEHLAYFDLLTDEEIKFVAKDISKNAAIEFAKMLGIGGRRNVRLAVIEEKGEGKRERDNLRTNKTERVNSARYLVDLNAIKSGGMGQILYGFDLVLHRPVAIKRVIGNADSQHKEYLKSEARTHAKSENRNVVSVYALLEISSQSYPEGNGPALVMEYLDPKTSPTLAAVLRGDDPRKTAEKDPLTGRSTMPPQEILRFVTDMMKALGNDNSPDRILHLDLKPQNIFQTPDGYKLADFGMASTVIDPRNSFGTPMYISPEKAVGGQLVDMRSEFFSLTSIVYELMVGVSYWAVDANGSPNHSPMDMAMTIVQFDENSHLKPHSELTAYCQKHHLDETRVLSFFRKSWAHNEDNRAQDFEEYLADLKTALTPV